MKSNFELMAVYNQWMNGSLYKAAATLSNDELEKNRGAFFGSIIGTLNHILVGDIIWFKRFANYEQNFTSLDYVRDLKAPASLDTSLCSELNELSEIRNKMDAMIVEFTSVVTEKQLVGPLIYTNTKGKTFTRNFGYLLQHLFNHQTHHRGQVSTLLYQAGVDIGVTDLLMVIPNE